LVCGQLRGGGVICGVGICGVVICGVVIYGVGICGVVIYLPCVVMVNLLLHFGSKQQLTCRLRQ